MFVLIISEATDLLVRLHIKPSSKKESFEATEILDPEVLNKGYRCKDDDLLEAGLLL